jgi:hypothetical protein
MSSMNSLMVAVGVSGVSNVTSQLEQVIQKVQGVDKASMAAAKGGLAMMAAAAVTAAAGVRNAMGDQVAEARLLGLNKTLEQTASIMQRIDRISSQGVFGKDQIIDAALTLEKSLAGSFEKNIQLVTRLGARMGSLDQAAGVIARLQRGQTFGIAMQLGEAGFGPDALKAAGLNVKGRNIENSPQEILAAIERIMAKDRSYAQLMGTLDAALRGFRHQLGETIQTVGQDLLPVLTALAEGASLVLRGFRWLNDRLFGSLGLIMAATLFWRGLTRTLPALGGFWRGLTGATGALNALAVAATRASVAAGTAGVASGASNAVGSAVGGAAVGHAAAKTGIVARVVAFFAGIWTAVATAAAGAWAWIVGVVTSSAFAIATSILAVMAAFTAAAAAVIYLIERIANLVRPGSVPADRSVFGPNGVQRLWTRHPAQQQSQRPAERSIRRDDTERLMQMVYARSFN